MKSIGLILLLVNLFFIYSQKINGDTGLYLDKTFTFALYEKFGEDMYAAYSAIGNMEGLDVEVNDGVATLITREIWHGWHGASLAQVPPTSATQSYFTFKDVDLIKFKIKSTQVKPTEIKFFMQPTSSGSGNLLEKTIADLGASDINDWKEISVSVASYKTTKMKVAMALCLQGGDLNREIQVKEIGFVSKDGKIADIKSTIVWPKQTGSTSPPEKEMALGTKIKKNGISLTLEWSDEFIQDDKLPDSAKWGYDIGDGLQTNTDGTFTNNLNWGNDEKEWYTFDNDKNAFVSDGTLKIKAIREKHERKDWTSSRMVTRNLKEFKYGYFEFRVKLPTSPGFWPAIWMLRHDIYDENGSGWPKGGEIDIIETSVNVWGLGKVYGTLHCEAGHSGNPIYSKGLQMCDIGDKWHTYGLYWKNDGISWYYDDQLVGRYKPTSTSNNAVWPFNQNFYIIMNLAVGGNLGGYIPDDIKEAQMEIDYVRVFSAEGEGNDGDNGPGNPPEEQQEDVVYEIDESLKSPIGLVVFDKGDGVVDIVWGNDPTVLADIYIVYVDGKKVAESGIPRALTVTVNSDGDHVFGVAAIHDGKSSKPTTMTLNIKGASK